jgi:hypothetical protein
MSTVVARPPVTSSAMQAPTAGDFLKPVPENPPATNSPATPGAASSTARLSAEVS